jgi:hypothetical protein
LKVGVWGCFGKVGKGVVEEWLLRLVAWLVDWIVVLMMKRKTDDGRGVEVFLYLSAALISWSTKLRP